MRYQNSITQTAFDADNKYPTQYNENETNKQTKKVGKLYGLSSSWNNWQEMSQRNCAVANASLIEEISRDVATCKYKLCFVWSKLDERFNFDDSKKHVQQSIFLL